MLMVDGTDGGGGGALYADYTEETESGDIVGTMYRSGTCYFRGDGTGSGDYKWYYYFTPSEDMTVKLHRNLNYKIMFDGDNWQSSGSVDYSIGIVDTDLFESDTLLYERGSHTSIESDSKSGYIMGGDTVVLEGGVQYCILYTVTVTFTDDAMICHPNGWPSNAYCKATISLVEV